MCYRWTGQADCIATEAAGREITRFDAELGGEIAPFAAVLLRSESAASSQIENLTASSRAHLRRVARCDPPRRVRRLSYLSACSV